MVGDLYAENDRRRDAGFSMFVFGINLGAVVAPWAVPWAAGGFGLHLFGSEQNFHAGFALAAIGMFFGLLQYIWDGKKYFPEGSLTPDDPLTEAVEKDGNQVGGGDRHRLSGGPGAHGCLPQLQR